MRPQPDKDGEWGEEGCSLNPVVLPQTHSQGLSLTSRASVTASGEAWHLALFVQHSVLSTKLPGAE